MSRTNVGDASLLIMIASITTSTNTLTASESSSHRGHQTFRLRLRRDGPRMEAHTMAAISTKPAINAVICPPLSNQCSSGKATHAITIASAGVFHLFNKSASRAFGLRTNTRRWVTDCRSPLTFRYISSRPVSLDGFKPACHRAGTNSCQVYQICRS